MDCRTLFTEMATRFDGAAAGDWSTVLQFHLSGDRGGDFTFRVADGACSMNEGTAADATCTISASDETWLGVVEGTVDPMGAFMTGKLKVKGNVGDALKLQDRAIFRRD
ncbi:MAG: SCP2 sterol-binding domain-containing protein [bacterium]|nr:SCP2 sterol-binding domain-containing protein [bacterium]